jgi:hypothetical protein
MAPKDKPISTTNPTGKKFMGGRGGEAYSPNAKAATQARQTRASSAKRAWINKADEEILGPVDGRQSRKRGGAAAGGNRARKSLSDLRTRQAEEEAYDPYAWLRDLMGGGGGGGGGGSVRSFSDEQIAQTQARLQAIYGRYADDIAAQEAAIGQTYDTAGTALGGIYDTSVGNINKAYDAARAAQTQQLLNLGMTEQTPVQSFGNQTAATSSLQNLRAAVLAQNEATRKASITNQRLSAEAARRQGTETVAQTVAQMQSAMTPVRGGGGGGGGGLNPYQYASLVLRQQEQDMSAQQAAAKLAGSGTSRPSVDWNALYNEGKEANMDDKTAIAYANSRAKYA